MNKLAYKLRFMNVNTERACATANREYSMTYREVMILSYQRLLI
jgi:hypothetical protein